LGSLTGVYSRFYRCPKKVAVTFGCSYLIRFLLYPKYDPCCSFRMFMLHILGVLVECQNRSKIQIDASTLMKVNKAELSFSIGNHSVMEYHAFHSSFDDFSVFKRERLCNSRNLI
jgi:hypothetical protein